MTVELRTASDTPPEATVRPASEIFAEVGALPGESASLGAVLDAFGPKTHALSMILLALPEFAPLPVPSVGMVLGPVIMLVAIHLAFYGDRAPLPRFIRDRKISTTLLSHLAHAAGPMLRRFEHISEPRWGFIAARPRMAGVVCAWLALLLALPLPFLNFLPATLIALIALGLIRGDGVMISVGYAGAAALTGGLIFAADRIVAILHDVARAWWPATPPPDPDWRDWIPSVEE